MSQMEGTSGTGVNATSSVPEHVGGNISDYTPVNNSGYTSSSTHTTNAHFANASASDTSKKIPESFGKRVTSNEASSPVPESLGTDMGPIDSHTSTTSKKGESVKSNSDISQGENGAFAGTLLTEDGHMEYDELTGDLHRVGESVDDYFFDFDPDMPLNKPLLDSFKKFALENKMSIATAKKIAHFYDTQMQKSNAEHLAKSHEEQVKMRSLCANDPEIGGAKFHENLRLAKAGIRRFDSEGNLAKILDETGFGSHPEVLRFMHRVGKAFAESPMVTGAKPKRELTTAELFYPSMRKK